MATIGASRGDAILLVTWNFRVTREGCTSDVMLCPVLLTDFLVMALLALLTCKVTFVFEITLTCNGAPLPMFARSIGFDGVRGFANKWAASAASLE